MRNNCTEVLVMNGSHVNFKKITLMKNKTRMCNTSGKGKMRSEGKETSLSLNKTNDNATAKKEKCAFRNIQIFKKQSYKMEVKNVGHFVLIFTILTVIGQGNSLQCWKCSSDIERACSDRFNVSDFYGAGGNRLYDNNYQNRPQYSQQQRQFDPNYNPNYPQSGGNYNPNYNANPNYNRNSMPFLETCDDNDARLRRMRNVCMKQVLRSSTYQTVIRRCAMIPMEEYAGTCQQELAARGLSLDFCEYCEYDGCNSANGVSFNALLIAGIVTATILGLFRL